MKTLTSIILAITTTLSFGQYTKIERSTKTIVEQRSIYLNGGTRASVGGKSRVVIPFDLPQNTVEWYYSFSTDAGISGTKNLNLAIQLSTLLVDQTGTTASLMNQVKVPSGSSSIDVYLLNSENQTAFEEKWDNNGGSIDFISEGTVKNTKQAVVMVDGAVIEARDIEAGLSEAVTINEGGNYDPPLGEGFSLIDHIEDIQRRFLLRAMQEAGGKKTAAAALLGYTNYQSLAAQLHRLKVDWVN